MGGWNRDRSLGIGVRNSWVRLQSSAACRARGSLGGERAPGAGHVLPTPQRGCHRAERVSPCREGVRQPGRGHLQLASPQLMSLILSKHNPGQHGHLHCLSDSEGEKRSPTRGGAASGNCRAPPELCCSLRLGAQDQACCPALNLTSWKSFLSHILLNLLK